MSEVNIKKIIVDAFKEEGLEIAEDVAIKMTKIAFKTIPKIVDATENQLDDYLKPLLALVEKPVLNALDKIDGKIG